MVKEDTNGDKTEQLKSALWLSIGKLVDTSCLDLKTSNATPQFIAALTELVYTQVGIVARDSESFAKHAGRTTVTAEDVLLLARRNGQLANILQEAMDQAKTQKDGGSSKKRKT